MNLIHYRAAQLSQLAYEDHEIHLKDAGFENISKIEDDDTGTFIWVCSKGDTVYAVARGTEPDDPRDIKTDLNADRKQDKKSGYRIHDGFLKAWLNIAPVLMEEVFNLSMEIEAKQTVYCGHSLGGAIMTIAAAAHNPQYLITFGQPKVAGKPFVQHLANKDVEYYRYVYRGDIVPRLLFWGGYKHGGTDILIDKYLRLHVSPSRWRYWTNFGRFFKRFEDHAVSNYVKTLRIFKKITSIKAGSTLMNLKRKDNEPTYQSYRG